MPLDPELLKLEDKKYLAHAKNRKENTDILSKKLDELKPKDKVSVEITNKPSDLAAAFWEMLRGEAGYTPTDEELVALIKPLIPEPIAGRDGQDGQTPTETELKKIIKPLIPKPIPGEKGEPGQNGADSTVPGPRGPKGASGKSGTDGITPTKKELVALITPLISEMGNNFLQQAKSFVPRALASLYDVDVRGLTDQQTLIWNASKQKFIPGTATGGGGASTTPFQENLAGTGTAFVLTHTPNQTGVLLQAYLNGQKLTLTDDYSFIGTVFTTVFSKLASDILTIIYNY